MNKFALVIFTLGTLSLVSCGKSSGGSNGTKNKNPLKTENEYTELLKGSFKSQNGEVEFNNNEIRLTSWTKIRHATDGFQNDFYLNCEFDRKGTFKVTKVGEQVKLNVTVSDAQVLNAEPQKGYEREISGFSTEKLKRLCAGALSKFKDIDARIVSTSENHVHLIKQESYSDYDYENQNYRVHYSEMGDDYAHFFIKGNELNVTQMFGKLYQGIYRDEILPYKRQLAITLDEVGGELTYNQWNEKCTDIGTFKMFYTLDKGLEARLEHENPCAENKEFSIYDLERGKDRDYIYLSTPFGFYSKIYSRKNNPRI